MTFALFTFKHMHIKQLQVVVVFAAHSSHHTNSLLHVGKLHCSTIAEPSVILRCTAPATCSIPQRLQDEYREHTDSMWLQCLACSIVEVVVVVRSAFQKLKSNTPQNLTSKQPAFGDAEMAVCIKLGCRVYTACPACRS